MELGEFIFMLLFSFRPPPFLLASGLLQGNERSSIEKGITLKYAVSHNSA